MTKVKVKLEIEAKDLKELNSKILHAADAVALMYEEWLQEKELTEQAWEEEGNSFYITDDLGEEEYGKIKNPKAPAEHWSYVLHSGRYRSQGGSHICNGHELPKPKKNSL